jgi:hypothetical protein
VGPDGKMVIGDPPIVSDLAAQHYDLRKKREMEHHGKYGKSKQRRSVYHGGPPVTIDFLPNIGVPYLEHAQVKVADGKERSLWELWYNRGVSLKDLPWLATDVQDTTVFSADSEVGPNTLNGWLYSRLNAETLRGAFYAWETTVSQLTTPEKGKMPIALYAKAFDKAFGEMEYDPAKRNSERQNKPDKVVFEPFTAELAKRIADGTETRLRINPRAVWLMGVMAQRFPDVNRKRNLGDNRLPKRNLDKAMFSTADNSYDRTYAEKDSRSSETLQLLRDYTVGFGIVSEEEFQQIHAFLKNTK